MANHVFIANQEGTLLWEGASSAAFLGLQAGESFWFGSLQERVWVSIISISYGLDTATGDFHVEIVVNQASPKPAKTISPKRKDINHGNLNIAGGCQAGKISIDEGRLVVMIREYNAHPGLKNFESVTIQLLTSDGRKSVTMRNVHLMTPVSLEGVGHEVVVTLVDVKWPDVMAHITEHLWEK
jgi:hypothetical protein